MALSPKDVRPFNHTPNQKELSQRQVLTDRHTALSWNRETPRIRAELAEIEFDLALLTGGFGLDGLQGMVIHSKRQLGYGFIKRMRDRYLDAGWSKVSIVDDGLLTIKLGLPD